MNTRIFLLAALLALSACQPPPAAQRRAARVAEAGRDVTIAVAWPLQSSKATLVDGITMALDEVNARGGVLGGRKLRLLLKDDAASLSKGRLVAQEIADDPDVAAVIGHLNSYIAAPAAHIYDRAGIVMVTPGASGQKLTEQGERMIFRSLPGNRDQGRQIGDYAAAQGYKRVAIYYIKNEYGIDLANFFEQRAHELGIAVADRRSYNMGGDNYAALLADWAAFLKPDAIFLAGSLPESAQIVREARAAGLTVPVFGAVGLDSPELIRRGGASVEGTVVFSLFNMGDPRPEVLAFDQRYRRRYGVFPDSSAAQGYDTLNLLVHAIDSAHSAVPADIAAALRATKNWPGVTGSHTFSEKGDPVAKALAKIVVRNGQFRYFKTNPGAPESAPLAASGS
ncbi:MAG: ABC transporter substrate-binding protein [Pseudomonadota bacterium]